jgi:hypothetical protein
MGRELLAGLCRFHSAVRQREPEVIAALATIGGPDLGKLTANRGGC